MKEKNVVKAEYDETMIGILITEVNWLFIYWTISDEHNNVFVKKYGKDFFEKTKEVLTIKNLKNGKEEKIVIEEPTNNYYAKFNYSNSVYQVELSRVGKEDDKDYGYRIISNEIQSPNIKILIDDYSQDKIRFRNIKTGEKMTETKYYKLKENSKEDVKRLYDDIIKPTWDSYKNENGYKEK